MRNQAIVGLAAVLVCHAGGSSLAATATGTLAVQITIVADCVVGGGALDFGLTGVLSANVDKQANISVTCTPGASYSISLDEGENASTPDDVSTRRMASGGATAFVGYQLYSDSARSTVWGSDTMSSTGTGSAQLFPVYGRVPPQATPAPGTYEDGVTITVTF